MRVAAMHLSIFSSENNDRPGPKTVVFSFVASFAISLLLLAGATEWLLKAQVAQSDTQAAHLRLLAVAETANAAFGDSHAARGFDAPSGFVNLAYPSENIEDMIAKIDTYYAARAPGQIILQADPHLFAPYRLFAQQQSYDQPTSLAITSDRHRPRLLAYWGTFLRNGGHLESKVEMTAAGSLLSEGDWSQVPPRRRRYEAQVRSNWHRIRDTERLGIAQERYAALLDDLTELGARLCLVSFPVSADYSKALENSGHDQLVSFFENQALRVGARYVDAREAISEPQLFLDVDHLNRLGAQQFSPGLIDDCFVEKI